MKRFIAMVIAIGALMVEYEVAPQSSADLYLSRCAASRSCHTLATRTGSRVAQRRPQAACP
jgi:hypothetical protein